MIFQRNRAIKKFIINFPGYKTFGLFVFMPLFFSTGAALEYLMIHWTSGETNFYKTYKRTQSQLEARRRLAILLREAENKPAV